MVPFFPKPISNKGFLLYVISMVTVSLVFFNYAIGVEWILVGSIEVAVFFLVAASLTQQWQRIPANFYTRYLFWLALVLRVVWVVFSYYFYLDQTGKPFEFDAADSVAYHADAEWLAVASWESVFDYLFVNRSGYSDSGYLLYLAFLYRLIGPNILVARLMKALYGAITCLLIYRLTRRMAGESTGRMAGVFAMLMPNLINYCGLHLKETEMLLLIVLFLERSDYVLRNDKVKVLDVIIPVLIAVSLFLFRTVLGAVALFSFVTGLVFYRGNVAAKRRRIVIILWSVFAMAYFAGGTIINEVEEVWQEKDWNQDVKREAQTSQGNLWAKYATGTVMAPMMFVLPFSTFVDTGQQNQLVMHGGNYVRNFMGVFVLIALYSAVFLKKNWRDFVLIGAFAAGYLGVVSFSGFSNSERFLLPGLPCLIVFWAYGVSLLGAKSYRFVRYWYWVVLAMEVGWAFFKIGSRGLL